METIKKDRDNSIDIMRGIAIIIVVLGHAIQINIGQGHSFVWEKIILAFQMPFMFFISGYTLGFSLPANKEGKTDFSFMRSKIKRILIPYFLWETIHYFIVALFLTGNRELSLKTYLLEFFYSDFWFLRFLFIYFLAVFAADWIMNKLKIKNLFLYSGGLLAFGAVLWMMKKVTLLNESISLGYYAWFIFGYIQYLIMNKSCIGSKYMRYRKPIAIVLCVVLIIYSVVLYIFDIPSICTTAIYVLTFFFILKSLNNCKHMKLIETIGKNTLPVYAIHWCVFFSPFYWSNWYWLHFNKIPLAFSCILTATVWLVLCLLLIKIFDKTKLTRAVLLGKWK